MKLKIYRYGEPVLREKAKAVAAVTDPFRRLAGDMLETMRAAGGVGLAAQQVGRRERICVIELPEDFDDGAYSVFNAPIQMPLVMFNPEILSMEGSVRDKEGCLSFPKVGGTLTRAERVTCRYLDLDNKTQTITAWGYLARAVQHEADHLDGILYVDHMSAVERLACAPKLKRLAKENGGAR